MMENGGGLPRANGIRNSEVKSYVLENCFFFFSFFWGVLKQEWGVSRLLLVLFEE